MTRMFRVGLPLLVLALLLMGSTAALAQENTTHTVVAYDSLDQIAAFYDVQPACLVEKNNLTRPDKLRVGDRIVIDFACPPYDGVDFVTNPRSGSSSETGTSSAATSGQGGGGGNAYTVQAGDTLDGIAAQFDVHVACLAEQNAVEKPNRIFAGQELSIPGNCPPYEGYDTVTNPRDG